MKSKGQNRGHCQRCGAIQVVLPDGTLAKHGYTVVDRGYFRGTCAGSAELPLQISRVITDAIIVAMLDLGNRNQIAAERLRSGATLPEKAQRLTAWGTRVYKIVDHKQLADMVDWNIAGDSERKMQIELDASEAESNARFFRGHAKSMTELATRVHGQPLIDRDAEELALKQARQAKTAPIDGAYRTKIEQKRDLENLKSQYSKLRRVIIDHYLSALDEAPGSPGEEVYYAIPHDLHQWREKHSLLVLNVYPQFHDTVNAIRGLVVARIDIKSRPVIK